MPFDDPLHPAYLPLLHKNKKNTDLNDYAKYLEMVALSADYMPKADALGDYSAVNLNRNLTCEWAILIPYYTDTIGLFLDYEKDAYETWKAAILEAYPFYKEGDETLESACDASIEGYQIRLAKLDYAYDTHNMGLLIGFNDANCKICYLYYYADDLDVLDNLDEFIETYFYLP